MIFDLRFAIEILPRLIEGALLTVLVTVLAFVVAAFGGVVILMVRRSGTIVAPIVGFLAEFIRSTPLLVQILFLYLALPQYGIVLDPLEVGVIGIGLHYSCYLAEVYRAGLEAVPRGQFDAATALSFGRIETYRRIVTPQVFQTVFPVLGNFLIYMYKDSPLLSVIAFAELMFIANEIGTATFRYLEPVTLAGVLFLVMGAATASLLRFAEVRIGRRWVRR